MLLLSSLPPRVRGGEGEELVRVLNGLPQAHHGVHVPPKGDGDLPTGEDSVHPSEDAADQGAELRGGADEELGHMLLQLRRVDLVVQPDGELLSESRVDNESLCAG